MKKALISLAFAALPLAAFAQADDAALVERGKWVATASDCAACHTNHAKHGPEYGGGLVLQSPIGGVVATNISPSKEFGIGSWTEEEFTRAVRKGVSPNGYLYPAMPYTAYAGITDEDMHALWTYLTKGVAPVDEAPAEKTDLPFPFNIRASMMGWNMLYGGGEPYKAADVAPGAPKRGEYLANALAHCQTCHTPRGELMGEDGSRFLAGADLDGWHAPNITSDEISGIGGWSRDELVAYLRDGAAHGKSQAAGPMAEAISLSLRHLDEEDLGAIADYLKTVPPIRDADQTVPAYGFAGTAPVDLGTLDYAIDRTPEAMADGTGADGAHLYVSACASCHQLNGQGTADQFYPSLTGNRALGSMSPNSAVMAILNGVHRETNSYTVSMPAFGSELTDAQVAAVSNYVFARFGNPDLNVTPERVAMMRAGAVETPLIVKAVPYLIAVGILVVLGVVLLLWRRTRTAG